MRAKNQFLNHDGYYHKIQVVRFPVIISFYTKGTPYEDEVQKLIESCRQFDLETAIEGVDSFGSWELNCAYKPFFIWQMLEKLERPLLWVDADGVFLKKPKWQEAFDADLSVRFHPELSWDHPSKVITSTLLAAPSVQGRAIIRKWIQETQQSLLNPGRTLEFWDQIALRDALRGWEGILEPLPLTYAKIFDHPSDCATAPDPIIEHYQASRRFKKNINS